MGGTASPLAWCMAYDPIVEGMHKALGVPAPTYVDDLAGLVVGPRQALRASFYLLLVVGRRASRSAHTAAGHSFSMRTLPNCAPLVVASRSAHTCRLRAISTFTVSLCLFSGPS